MSEERKKILEMLSEGKITAEEADRLLSAVADNNARNSGGSARKELKYLRIMVEPGPDSKSPDRVNIRVPLKLIKAGLKLAALIPKNAQTQVNDALHQKGIDMDFSQIKPDDLEDIIKQLDDFTVDVEGKESVRIFCE